MAVLESVLRGESVSRTVTHKCRYVRSYRWLFRTVGWAEVGLVEAGDRVAYP